MKNSISIGAVFLRISLAFLLIVTGVWGMTGYSTLFTGVIGAFSGTAQTIVIWIISIASLITGVLLLLEFFVPNFTFVDIILLVFTILWIIQIVLAIAASIGSAFTNGNSVLNFLNMLAYNFLILAALLICQKRFQ